MVNKKIKNEERLNKVSAENKSKTDDVAIMEAIRAIRTKFGEGSIMKLGEAPKLLDVGVISTGSIGLDMAIGVGGFPRGRIIEIYGPESSGKSTLAMHAIAEAQKAGGICAYIDAEHAMDPEYAKKLGVKIDDLLISQPDNGEQALEIAESLVHSGKIDIIVVDSVAALTPKDEIEGDMGAYHVGKQARLMSQALRKLTAIVAKSKTIIIFINQIRMQIGVMFGCLNYKSKVTLADGTQDWIGRIVNQRKEVEVLSYDPKRNRIVPAKITGWYKNGTTDKFLQISVYDPSGSGVAHLSCTTNHPILTPIGYRPAENLKPSDKVQLSVIHRLSDFQKEIIRGSLLGDGNLSPTYHKESMGVRFRLGHGLKQKGYLLWKASLFKNISQVIYEDKKSIKFDMTPLPELYEMRKSMYKDGYKFLSSEFLAALTPLSLAIWYMDDSHLDIRNKKSTGDKGRATICVQAIHSESRKLLQNLLKEKYDIQTRLGIVKNKEIMYFDQINTEKFLQLIKYYVHPSMGYKLLPRYKDRFGVEPKFIEPYKKLVSVPIIKISEKPKTRSMMRFDIRVRGYHNFLADNIVVHNSPETTTGGKALKFYASVRLDIRRIAQIKKGEEVIGSRTRVKVVKNKVAAPFKQTEFDIIYNEGISKEGEIIALGEKFKILEKAGNSYFYLPAGEEKEKVKLGVGYDNTRTFLKENSKIAEQILKEIRKKFMEEV